MESSKSWALIFQNLIQIIHLNHQADIFPYASWIKHGLKVTLFLLSKTTTPKQGYLLQENDKWFFAPRQLANANKNKFPRLNFFRNCLKSRPQQEIIQRLAKNIVVTSACTLQATSNLLDQHVNASGLTILDFPPFINMVPFYIPKKFYGMMHIRRNIIVLLKTHGKSS